MKPPSASAALGLLASLGLTFAAAAVGATASVRAGAFYGQLIHPAWAPPGWLFGPVWSALYLVQLVLNALWSWLFFAWHRGGAASLEILLLWALILATLLAFGRIRRVAAVLLLPYLAWVAISKRG